jgi:hypothetical protein
MKFVNMQKKKATKPVVKKEIVVKTNLTFEELMKKALNTPLTQKKKEKNKK